MIALIVAACLAGWCVWVATGARPGELRLSLLRAGDDRESACRAHVGHLRAGALAAVAVAAGVVLALQLRSPVPAMAVPLAAYGLRRWRRATVRAAAESGNRWAAAELCVVLAAELRAGRPPADALIRATGADQTWPPYSGGPALLAPRARAAAVNGSDVAVAMRADAEQPGAESLRRLAACWQVAHTRGAGLAAAVDRLGDALRSEEGHRREVDAEIAGARATARILALLPVVGLLMGAGLGARPLDVLLRTPYGVACLFLGGTLVAAGLLWTERIARSAVLAGPDEGTRGRAGQV